MKPFPTPCSCASPGLCERHRRHKTAEEFHLCRTQIDFFQRWEAAADSSAMIDPTEASLPPCIHRGTDPLEHVTCDFCGAYDRLIPVFPCGLLGECTERRFSSRTERARQMPSCLGCEFYTARDTG